MKPDEMKPVEIQEGANNPGEIVSLLLKKGLLTKQKAMYAMRVKSKLSPDKTLIDTLKDLKYIDEKLIKDVLRTNRLSLRIGDLLVELGYMTREKLTAALSIQKSQKNKRLGQIIVENQFMTESAFIDALSVQLGFPFIDLSIEDVDSKVIEKTPGEISDRWNFGSLQDVPSQCRHHGCLPDKDSLQSQYRRKKASPGRQNDPQADLSGIVTSREADLLGIPEIGVAELEIALEDARINRPM